MLRWSELALVERAVCGSTPVEVVLPVIAEVACIEKRVREKQVQAVPLHEMNGFILFDQDHAVFPSRLGIRSRARCTEAHSRVVSKPFHARRATRTLAAGS